MSLLRPPSGYKWARMPQVTGTPAHLFTQGTRQVGICWALCEARGANWADGADGREYCLACIDRAMRRGAAVPTKEYADIVHKLYVKR